jgi:ABC-type branched-subunit amino acid transport system ATPase component/branched-subunit amino acid ABC-type transport system permease component
MSEYLPFVVIGLTTGSVYALAATGLVLTYRTSRILNFAHGSMATVTVLMFFALVYRLGVPWRIAVALAVLGVGPATGAAFAVLGRRLGSLTTEAKVLATIGLLLLVNGSVILWGRRAYGSHPTVHPALPGSLVRVFGVNIGVDQIIIVAVGLASTGLLHVVLEHTTMGRSMRAVVDNPELLGLTGRNPNAALRAGWALGIGFVTLAGLLLVLSPNNSAPASDLDLLVLQAFGAAAIGGFSNLPLTYAGGLLIGVLSALCTKFVVDVPSLGGLPGGIPFLVLFLLLVAVPGRFARTVASPAAPRRPRVIAVPVIWRYPLAGLVAAGLVLVGLSGSVHLVYAANEGLSYAVLFLGLGLLVRTSGQVSLCQIGLAAVGAAACAHMADGFGLPWLAAVLVGGLAAAAVGAVVAIPAIRVAGIYVAVATFGFGALLEQFLYPTKFLFGTANGTTVPRPSIWGLNGSDDVTFFCFLVAIFVLGAALVLGLRRSRLGRLLRALGDSPIALEAQGTSIDVTRVAVFSISAFLAGIGGALLVSQLRFLLTTPFDSTASLSVFVVLFALRITEPVASLAAGAAFVVVPSFLRPRAAVWWLDVGFGAAALVAALIASETWLPRWKWAAPKGRALKRWAPRAGTPTTLPPARVASPNRAGLEVRDLSVHYKGTVAVSGLSLAVPPGRITGLIGPNGAGKTTTFDFCSGLVRARKGRVLLNGRDITGSRPATRARAGLGRTFQRVNLFNSMTVAENVQLGAEGAVAGANPITQIFASRRQVSEIRQAALEAMQLAGIDDLAGREVGSLSTGEKRLVEIARCLAGRFDILLLDEPASGLDAPETRRMGGLLQQIVADRGLGILVVEHDMSLVIDVCTYLYVLDFGHLIYEGPPDDVMASDVVRAAYLGTDAVGSAQ